jgi:CMP-N,N'-diacetyllegionaminic acid synthase
VADRQRRSSALGLVPARGGSRTIPRKNIRPLAGRPLISHVLGAIRESGAVDRVVVSTDDEEIAAVARDAGAETPFLRPAELAGDEVSGIAVVEHALRRLAEEEGYEPEFVLLVQPTEPFVRPEQIRAAFELLVERGADSAITTVEVPRNFHPFHVRAADGDGWLRFDRPDEHAAHPTRQSDPPRYAFGNLYWFRREAFLAERQVEPGRRVGLPIDPLSALDLNTEEDWRLAELLAAHADDPPR